MKTAILATFAIVLGSTASAQRALGGARPASEELLFEVRDLGLPLDVRSPLHIEGDHIVFALREVQVDRNMDGDVSDHILASYDIATAATSTYGLAVRLTHSGFFGYPFEVSNGCVAVCVDEASQSADLNGDGDTSDFVLHVVELATGQVTNLGRAVSRWFNETAIAVNSDILAFLVDEARQGHTDLNGDGDALDVVMHIHRLSSGTTLNLQLPGYAGAPFQHSLETNNSVDIQGDQVAWSFVEQTDLNGDGFLRPILADYDVVTGQTTLIGTDVQSLRIGFSLVPDLLAFVEHEALVGDLNCDGDATDDQILHTYRPSVAGPKKNEKLDIQSVTGTGELVVITAREIDNHDFNFDSDVNDIGVQIFHVATGVLIPLNRPIEGTVYPLQIQGNLFFYNVPEVNHGTDLNGDGDVQDKVIHLYDAGQGTLTNLGLARDDLFPICGETLAVFRVSETAQGGQDLDGDGLVSSGVLFAYDMLTGTIHNLHARSDTFNFKVDGRRVVYRSSKGIIEIYDADARATIRLGHGATSFASIGRWTAFWSQETLHLAELNY